MHSGKILTVYHRSSLNLDLVFCFSYQILYILYNSSSGCFTFSLQNVIKNLLSTKTLAGLGIFECQVCETINSVF